MTSSAPYVLEEALAALSGAVGALEHSAHAAQAVLAGTQKDFFAGPPPPPVIDTAAALTHVDRAIAGLEGLLSSQDDNA